MRPLKRLVQVIEDRLDLRLVARTLLDPLGAHDAVPIYDEIGALREAGLVADAVLLDDLLVEVREQREAYASLLRPGAVRPGAVGADAQHPRAPVPEASDLPLHL